jgi:hypothetical protein
VSPETLVWLHTAFWGLVVVVLPYIIAPVGCLLICRRIKQICLRQARESLQAAEEAWIDAEFLYLLGVRARDITEGVDREAALRLLYHNPDFHQEALHHLVEFNRNRGKSNRYPWGAEVKRALTHIQVEHQSFPPPIPDWVEGHLKFMRSHLGRHKEPSAPQISRFQREEPL